MAKATVETIQPTPPPKKVLLELSEDEAGLVYALLAHCPKPPAYSVYNALAEVFVGHGDGVFESVVPTGKSLPRLK